MVLAKAVAGAVIGGAVGAAIWAGIAYGTGYEIGWIAWGVGLLAGGGTYAFVRDEADATTGITAAVVAVMALAVGRYASVVLTVDSVLAKEMPGGIAVDEEAMLVKTADEVVGEWEGNGKKINWPEGVTLEDADEESEYPKDVWKEAQARWSKLTPEEQTEAKATEQREVDALIKEFRATVVQEGFTSSFDMMDILFCGLAILTAYKLGAGMTSKN
jgi:hypothetical protein